jgi:hypothetical protein
MTTKLHLEHHAQAALTSNAECDGETGPEVRPFEQHPLGLILHMPDDHVPMRLQRLKRSPAGGKATSVSIAQDRASTSTNFSAAAGATGDFCAQGQRPTGRAAARSVATSTARLGGFLAADGWCALLALAAWCLFIECFWYD